MKTSKSLLVSLFITLAATLPAAAVPRIFVSGLGNDANPGSITSPKRSFASALTVTDPGGEIIVLDSAGYGPVTINKSVSIISPTGVYAGITVPVSTDGVDVNIGASDVVILRGLTINSAGGDTGINFFSAGTLHVENCVVNGFAGSGDLGITASAGGQLFVKDTTIRGCNDGVAVSTSTVTRVSLTNVRLDGNGVGAFASGGGGKISARDCVACGNSAFGFLASSLGEVNIESCLVSNSAGTGIVSSQAGTVVRVSNCTVTDNGTGLSVLSGGTMETRQNNTVRGNGTDVSGPLSPIGGI
jgi:parallel beta helix pectate lyase-like protein